MSKMNFLRFPFWSALLLCTGASCSAPAPANRTGRSTQAVPVRPAWIDPKNPFQYENGKFIVLGQTVTPPGAGIEEGYIVAGNSAKEVICKATQYRLDVAFQDSEEGSYVNRD